MIFPTDARPLIPQKEPFVMVDELLFADDSIAKSQFKITPESPFYIDGSFHEGGLLENMAQTAAAHAGFVALNNQSEIKKGFIGAVNNFEIFKLPVTGDMLVTEILIKDQVLDVTLVSGAVYCEEVKIASAELKIFIEK